MPIISGKTNGGCTRRGSLCCAFNAGLFDAMSGAWGKNSKKKLKEKIFLKSSRILDALGRQKKVMFQRGLCVLNKLNCFFKSRLGELSLTNEVYVLADCVVMRDDLYM